MQGNPPVPRSLYREEWDRRGLGDALNLSFSSCLGPCSAANVVYLRLDGRSLWLGSLDNAPQSISSLLGYIEQALHSVTPPPLTSDLARRLLRRSRW